MNDLLLLMNNELWRWQSNEQWALKILSKVHLKRKTQEWHYNLNDEMTADSESARPAKLTILLWAGAYIQNGWATIIYEDWKKTNEQSSSNKWDTKFRLSPCPVTQECVGDDSSKAMSFVHHEDEMTCYSCGKKGHLSPKCDQRNMVIPREKWHVN
jgi:hypothetical protein